MPKIYLSLWVIQISFPSWISFTTIEINKISSLSTINVILTSSRLITITPEAFHFPKFRFPLQSWLQRRINCHLWRYPKPKALRMGLEIPPAILVKKKGNLRKIFFTSGPFLPFQHYSSSSSKKKYVYIHYPYFFFSPHYFMPLSCSTILTKFNYPLQYV